MEQFLVGQGVLGACCLALLGVVRKLYSDLMISKENERNALLRMLNSERSGTWPGKPTPESRSWGKDD